MVVDGICKKYRKKQVLSGVSFAVAQGECIGILGSNGSGKSTLLSILAGVQSADNGSFLLEGTDLLSNDKIRSKLVAYVPQRSTLMEDLNAWDNLRLWYEKNELKQELSQGVLKRLGIDEYIRLPVKKMSVGMKKRVAIGCAMAGNPKVLLLDEPSAALDIDCKKIIADYIQEYKSKGGRVVIVTHDEGEFHLCDRLYTLSDGSLHLYEKDVL